MLNGRILAGRYRLLDPLGEGGMAVVYRAHDERLDRAVAVKILRAGFGADPEFLSRFRQEARHAASLHHPNIVTVHDSGSEDGIDFIVMQLVDGEDLERMLTRVGALQINTATRIVVEVARALEAAHGRGIVHRDVKPANILLEPDGAVRVADFGIARAANAAGVTTAGLMLGSAQYVSPEQVLGEEITPASDIYSLGVVLYEAVTGRRPFDGPAPAAVALERLRVRPAPPSAVAPNLPDGIDQLVMRALERDPADRYPSAGDFAAALESWRLRSLGGVRRHGAGARASRRGLAPAALAAAGAGASWAAATGAGAMSARARPNPQMVGPATGEATAVAPVDRLPMGWQRTPRERSTDETPRDRRLAAGWLLPILGLAILLGAGLVVFRAMEGAGGVASATGTPGSSAVGVIPSATPTRAPTPTQTPIPPPTPTLIASPEPTATLLPTPLVLPPPTPRPTPRPTPTAAPPVAPDPAPSGPAQTVARFYDLVVDGRFDEAAALWTPAMRQRYPPRQYIDGRFAPTMGIDLQRNEVVALNLGAGTATVAVDIIEYRSSGPSPRRFVGDWDLVLVDGRWLMNDPDF